jgi:NAD(P)H-dependent FMN reductase
MTTIAIVTGSTRPGRKADAVARWVHNLAADRDDATFDVVDIADFALPHLDEATPPIMGRYEHAHTHAWSTTIAGYDGYVFVTPEYNHSTSGALKNAIDFLFAEWNDKSCGFVSYGVQGGTRAVEHLRLVAGELKLADVRSQVALTLGTDLRDGVVVADQRQLDAAHTMLGEVVTWSRALSTLRSATRAAAS